MKRTRATTEYRKELKGKILEVALCEFKQKGIRAVKMDDIARMLTISKRTLYEIYPNKEELLLECFKFTKEHEEAEVAAFLKEAPRTTMDILLNFYRTRMKELSELPSTFLTEIDRYPLVVEFLKQKHESSQEKMKQFFQRGVEEGYFREDVDYTLIARLGENMMHNAMVKQLYIEYELPYIFRNVIFLFLRGFCTRKGLDIVDKTLNENP